MANNNIIKPVEGLQNIGALSPVQQRNQRKQKQSQKQQSDEDANHDEAILNELTDEQNLSDEITGDNKKPDSDGTGIDYCA